MVRSKSSFNFPFLSFYFFNQKQNWRLLKCSIKCNQISIDFGTKLSFFPIMHNSVQISDFIQKFWHFQNLWSSGNLNRKKGNVVLVTWKATLKFQVFAICTMKASSTFFCIWFRSPFQWCIDLCMQKKKSRFWLARTDFQKCLQFFSEKSC